MTLGVQRSTGAMRRGLRRAAAALQPARGYTAKQILVAPQDLRISDPTTAQAILAGELLFAGRFVRSEGPLPFLAAAPGDDFVRKLHGFGWLRHFRGLPEDVGPVEARRLISGWINLKPKPPAALDGEAAARRVIAFISHSPLVLKGADSPFYAAYLAAISADVARLRTILRTAEAAERLMPSLALVYAALGCKGLEPLIAPACDALVAAIAESILPDGAHRSRNPARTVDLCFDLLPLRQALGIRERPMPKSLSEALSAMLRMLRTLCHRDRRLVTFNGAGPAIVSDLAVLLAHDRAEALHSPSTGASRYLRLDAGQTTVFMDGGAPPPQAYSREHHFAPLALEWSHFDRRIVVSCGSPPPGLPQMAEIARRTAAHSTLEIDGTDTAVALAEPGGAILRGAKSVEIARLDSPGWTLIDSAMTAIARSSASTTTARSHCRRMGRSLLAKTG